MQKLTLAGNLTADPERHEGENPRTTFTLAVSERYRDKNGEFQQGQTTFTPVKAWGKLGENAAELQKGDRVLVVGTLSIRNVKDEVADGAEESYSTYVDVTAEDIGVSVAFAPAANIEKVGAR